MGGAESRRGAERNFWLRLCGCTDARRRSRIILRESLPIFTAALSPPRIHHGAPFSRLLRLASPNGPDSACKTANIDAMNFQLLGPKLMIITAPSRALEKIASLLRSK